MLGRAYSRFVCEWLRHSIANAPSAITPLNWVLGNKLTNLDALIEEAYIIFSEFDRPDHFQKNIVTDPEAADNNQLLRKRNRKTLQLDDVVGSLNPITNITAEDMAYFMPRILELAQDVRTESTWGDCYLFWFVIQFDPEFGWKKFTLFKQQHIQLVHKILNATMANCIQYLKEQCIKEDLQKIVTAWEMRCA